MATNIRLDRSRAHPAGVRGVHLAVFLSFDNCSYLPTIQREIPYFRTLNIQSESISSVGRFLNELFGQGLLKTYLNCLFIVTRERKSAWDPHLPSPQNESDITCPMPTRASLISLLVSLSALRIRGIGIRWNKIQFSNHLVELRVQGVIYDSNALLIDLLQSLVTAFELRDLKLISIITFPGSTIPWTSFLRKFLYPKLESFLLEDLNFTALTLLIHSVVPGSHRLQLALIDKYRWTYLPGGGSEQIDIEEVRSLLKRVVFGTLVLWVASTVTG